MDANKLWEQYNAFHKRYTAKYRPAIYKALQDQVNYYIKTKDLANLPQKPMQDILMKLYIDVGRIWGMNTYYNILRDLSKNELSYLKQTNTNSEIRISLKRNGAIGLNEEFIQAIIDFFNIDLFNTVTNITETTRKFIRQVVADGILNQLGLDDIINELQTSGLTKDRSALIARTETMKGANAAEQIGTDATGLQTNKVWIAVRDKRTRFDHVNVDNAVVPDGQPFNVGGYLMLRPGVDRTTDGQRVPAKEICNCRCVVSRKVLRGTNGLPLRKGL